MYKRPHGLANNLAGSALNSWWPAAPGSFRAGYVAHADVLKLRGLDTPCRVVLELLQLLVKASLQRSTSCGTL